MEDPETFESGLSADDMDRVLETIDFSDVLARGGRRGPRTPEATLDGSRPARVDPSEAGDAMPASGAALGAPEARRYDVHAAAPIVCEVNGLARAAGTSLDALTIRGRQHVALVAETPDEARRLVECIAGLSGIGDGRLDVFGHALHALAPDALASARAALIGVVVERIPLIDSLTVEDNLRVALLGAGVEGRAASARVAELTSQLALGALQGRHPIELDAAATWRVLVARAFAHRPPLCVVDVSSIELDPVERASVFELVRSMIEHTRTTVVVACPGDAVPSWAQARVSTAPPPATEPALELDLEA
jgi:putative ABC transport system ATP-binding protein